MNKLFVVAALAVASVAAIGCSKAAPPGGEGAFANDLKVGTLPGPTPTARTGVADDGVKPKVSPVAPPQTARGGIPDDSIKPGPVAPLQTARGGIPDDSIKPKPGVGPLPKPR